MTKSHMGNESVLTLHKNKDYKMVDSLQGSNQDKWILAKVVRKAS